MSATSPSPTRADLNRITDADEYAARRQEALADLDACLARDHAAGIDGSDLPDHDGPDDPPLTSAADADRSAGYHYPSA